MPINLHYHSIVASPIYNDSNSYYNKETDKIGINSVINTDYDGNNYIHITIAAIAG